MKLAEEVQKYTATCEALLSAIAVERPLTEVEAKMIEYYCKELMAKIPLFPFE